ncbi:hypothetical protein [Saccharothrix syringae]|uniref:Uncharacterized protein n=1 Tax=Saccharothrix syringae TaxID=103733 RepID=A0A5Q0H5E5_SACSY|nr:hypothetical protein [Saccharothrix syringae]QFZ21458.1 hypothetical protein EKG83_32355 [Saccharothrix syringae]
MAWWRDRSPPDAPVVGRTTAVAAHDVLTRDGRIVRRQGSGTRAAPVARRDPGEFLAGSVEPVA